MVSFVREDPSETSNVPEPTNLLHLASRYDTGAGALGQGIDQMGKAISVGVAGVNEALDYRAQEETRTVAAIGERLNNLPSDEPLPKDMQDRLDMIKARKEAADGGGVSKANFDNWLLAEAKHLKTRYAGHKSTVDKVLRSMGYDPARDILSRRLSEEKAIASAANAKVKADKSFVDWSIKQDPLSHNEWMSAGGKGGVDGLRTIVARNGARNAQMDYQLKTLEMEDKIGDVNEEKAKGALENQAVMTVDQLIMSSTGGVQSAIEKVDAHIKDVQGGRANQENLASVRESLARSRVELSGKLRATLASNPIYAKYPALAAEAEAKALKRYDNFVEGFLGESPNIINLTTLAAEAGQLDLATPYLSDPDLVNIANVERALGIRAAPDYLKRNGKVTSTKDSAKTKDGEVKVLLSDQPVGSITNDMKTWAKEGVKDTQAYKSHLDIMQTAITDEKFDDRAKVRAMEYMFGPENRGFVSVLRDDERAAIFARIATPKAFAEIERVADANNRPDLKVNFQAFLNSNFSAIVKDKVEDINAIVRDTSGPRVKLNPNTYTLELDRVKMVNGIPIEMPISISAGRNFEAASREWNTAIQPIINLWKQKGYTPDQIGKLSTQLIAASGIDLSGVKVPGMWQTFVEGIKKGVGNKFGQKDLYASENPAGAEVGVKPAVDEDRREYPPLDMRKAEERLKELERLRLEEADRLKAKLKAYEESKK